jgi:hypothetical protein
VGGSCEHGNEPNCLSSWDTGSFLRNAWLHELCQLVSRRWAIKSVSPSWKQTACAVSLLPTVYTHTHTQTHTQTQNTQTPHKRTHTNAHTHTKTQTNTHKRTHTNTHTNKHKHKETEVQLHMFLTSSLDGGKRSLQAPASLQPCGGGEISVTHQTGYKVRPRTGL